MEYDSSQDLATTAALSAPAVCESAPNACLDRTESQRRPRVAFVGESTYRSAPSSTLARALRERGFECRFSEGMEGRSSWKWLRFARESSAIVVVRYDAVPRFALRQLALAAAVGTPVIRWWVGTDVLHVLENAQVRRSALALQSVLGCQLAVSPHLVAELASVGLRAEYVPSVLDPGPVPQILGNVPKSLLLYFPGTRREFFREATLRAAIEAFPDIEFVIVGDDTRTLAHYPNVQDLGWVTDMEPVWDRVGGLLRLTRHDGMPRMILDALRRGKHVLYSWPFPGCELTQTDHEVLEGVARFREASSINARGIEEVGRLIAIDPAEQFAEIVVGLSTSFSLMRRLSAACVSAMQTLRMKAVV